MSPINKLFGYLLFFLISTHGNIASATDYAAPYRPYAKELQINQIDLTGLTEEDYADMALNDARLENAYISVLLSFTGGEFTSKRPEIIGALVDMRKRGDSITPMLLKLMNENQETGFEMAGLVSIPAVRSLKLEPYLDYARKALRERTQTMNAGLAGCASILLASHGNKDDAKLMKWVMEQRPWLADSITRNLDELNRRLNLPKQDTRPPLRDAILRDGKIDWNARRVPQRPPLANDAKQPESASSLVYGLLLLVSSTLIWLVVKNRKKNT